MDITCATEVMDDTEDCKMEDDMMLEKQVENSAATPDEEPSVEGLTFGQCSQVIHTQLMFALRKLGHGYNLFYALKCLEEITWRADNLLGSKDSMRASPPRENSAGG